MFTTDKGEKAMVAKEYEMTSFTGKKFSVMKAFTSVDDLQAFVDECRAANHDIVCIEQIPYSKNHEPKMFNKFSHFKGKAKPATK